MTPEAIAPQRTPVVAKWIVKIVDASKLADTLNELEAMTSPAGAPVLTTYDVKMIMVAWRHFVYA